MGKSEEEKTDNDYKDGAVTKNALQVITIIGEIEGHDNLPATSKATKYEHMLPKLAEIEMDKDIKGVLFIMNTVGGDVSAGLALAEMIASMNTPLGMIVAGANLAQGNILKSLKNKRLYYLSFIKLIVYPLAGLVVLWLLPLEFEVAFTVFIALACPAGASVIMFAQRYDRDAYYASEIFVITTLLSVVTIPLLSIVAVNLLS